MAFPFSAVAQDEESESGQDQLEALARRLKPKQKQYPTRVIRGRVVNAATGNPIALSVPTTLMAIVRSLKRTVPSS